MLCFTWPLSVFDSTRSRGEFFSEASESAVIDSWREMSDEWPRFEKQIMRFPQIFVEEKSAPIYPVIVGGVFFFHIFIEASQFFRHNGNDDEAVRPVER